MRKIKLSEKSKNIIAIIIVLSILLTVICAVVDVSRRLWNVGINILGTEPGFSRNKKAFNKVAKKALEIFEERCELPNPPEYLSITKPYSTIDEFKVSYKSELGEIETYFVKVSKSEAEAYESLISAYHSSAFLGVKVTKGTVTFRGAPTYYELIYVKNPFNTPYSYHDKSVFMDRLSLHWFEIYHKS